jgi:pyruvate/2-oxoglutarate dehydrogenase complex dihydrolipoamide acyltransferase (E2) component
MGQKRISWGIKGAWQAAHSSKSARHATHSSENAQHAAHSSLEREGKKPRVGTPADVPHPTKAMQSQSPAHSERMCPSQRLAGTGSTAPAYQPHQVPGGAGWQGCRPWQPPASQPAVQGADV